MRELWQLCEIIFMQALFSDSYYFTWVSVMWISMSAFCIACGILYFYAFRTPPIVEFAFASIA